MHFSISNRYNDNNKHYCDGDGDNNTVFVYMLSQQLNGEVQNRQEYKINDDNTCKQTKSKYEQNTRWNKRKILQFN